MKDRDRYRGCLVGGAAGDALGYAIEFYSYERIVSQYGPSGITEYTIDDNSHLALISDDTQMTLFTAAGLLEGDTWARIENRQEEDYAVPLWHIYQDWFLTQGRTATAEQHSWLNGVRALRNRRAPGNTCMRALREGRPGSLATPLNDSKGCGGVMRVAPVGLYCGDGADENSIERVGKVATVAAALTHGHELGYIPAAGLAHIVNLAAHCPKLDLREVVLQARDILAQQFAGATHIGTMLHLLDEALRLSEVPSDDDVMLIGELGEGWVAEETLAIAVLCSLRYSNDFARAITAAVNHRGDSDSTGAVAGNIMGAYVGLDRIPEDFKQNLECYKVIVEMADDLYKGIPENLAEAHQAEHVYSLAAKRWLDKYAVERQS